MTDDTITTSDTVPPPETHDDDKGGKEWTFIDIGAKLFELRDYTPIPLVVLLLFAAEPSARSATLGTLFAVWWRGRQPGLPSGSSSRAS